MSLRKTPQPAETPAVLVIEPGKFERRSLCRLMRAAGADRVAEAIDVESAGRILAVRRWPQWLLVADPDRLAGDGLAALRALLTEHPVTAVLLLTQHRPPATEALRAAAVRCGLPVIAVVHKPISAEQAGTLLRGLGPGGGTPAGYPNLSRDELNDCLRSGRAGARFEPKVDLVSGRPLACEAIAYVIHGRHGEVPAPGFAHAMMQLGAQRVMTASVLREAAALVRALREKDLDAKVAINLGYEVLSEPGDALALDTYVRTLGIAPADLILELDAGRHAGAATLAENLARLKLGGYALALDRPASALALDHPALAHFSELKLDWAPMNGAAQPASDQRNLSALIAAARKHGMTACALGVRTAADLHQVRQAGFDAAQGAVFSTAMPAAEAALWMEREERNRSFADCAMRRNQAS